MKKSTKALWIYTGVLFSIAIVLIIITTFMQTKIVDDNGNLSVMGTLTATSEQKIKNLQNENVQLSTELNALKQEHAATVENVKAMETKINEEQAIKEKVAQLYQAYADGDVETMEKLFSKLTEEQIEERIPTLYKRVKRTIED